MINPMKHPGLFRRLMSLWPPFLGAGIQVDPISPDWSKVKVSLHIRRKQGQ